MSGHVPPPRPPPHTTTTTTTTAVGPTLYFNQSYLRSVHGILKAAHLGLSLLLFICAMSSMFSRHPRTNYLGFVSMTGFWCSAILLLLYVLNIVTHLTRVPWVKMELGYTSLMTLFALIAAILAIDGISIGFDAAYGAAAFFAFALTLAYAVNAWLLYGLMKEGVRLVTTETAF